MSLAPRKEIRPAFKKNAAPASIPAPLAKIFSTRLSSQEKRDRISDMLKRVMPWNKKRLRLMFEEFAAAQRCARDKLNAGEAGLKMSAFEIPLPEKLAQQERIVRKTEKMAVDASHIRHRYAVAAAALADHPRAFRGADRVSTEFADGYKQIDADIARRERHFAGPARDGIPRTKRQIGRQKKKLAVAEAENPGALLRPITVGRPLRFRL